MYLLLGMNMSMLLLDPWHVRNGVMVRNATTDMDLGVCYICFTRGAPTTLRGRTATDNRAFNLCGLPATSNVNIKLYIAIPLAGSRQPRLRTDMGHSGAVLSFSLGEMCRSTSIMNGNYPISTYVRRKIKIKKKSNQKIKLKKNKLKNQKKYQKIIKSKSEKNQQIIKKNKKESNPGFLAIFRIFRKQPRICFFLILF